MIQVRMHAAVAACHEMFSFVSVRSMMVYERTMIRGLRISTGETRTGKFEHGRMISRYTVVGLDARHVLC